MKKNRRSVFDAILDSDDRALEQALVDSSADLDFIEDGTSPLGLAVSVDNLSAVTKLLRQGVNPDLQLEAGERAVHIAAAESPRILELLVKNGAQIDVADDDGVTPLMIAAKSASESEVQLLLRHGANASRIDIEGRSALHWATLSDSDDPRIVTMLMKAGLDPASKTLSGISSTEYAQRLNKPRTHKALARPS